MATALALVIVPFALRLYRGGDAKLLIALGAWLGASTVAWAFLFGVALGAVVAVFVLLGASRAERARIGANLTNAARTASIPEVEPERDARLHVPMAVAFAAGALLALTRG